MTRNFLRFSVLAALFGGAPGFAAASSPIAQILCEPTAQLNAKLSRQFGAKPKAWGTRGPEQLMQVWTAQDGDWTMVMRYAGGTSCIVAMGENWFVDQAENPA